MNSPNSSAQNDETSYLSPIGSAISLIGFFCPWVGCEGRILSGIDLGDNSWIVLLSSLISLLAFFFFRSQRTLSKAKSIVAICSLVGLGFIGYKYLKLQDSILKDAFVIKWGAIMTVVGFILSLLGIFSLEDKTTTKTGEGSLFCTNCGKKYPSGLAGSFCEECGNKL
jgi:hypothetical protein